MALGVPITPIHTKQEISLFYRVADHLQSSHPEENCQDFNLQVTNAWKDLLVSQISGKHCHNSLSLFFKIPELIAFYLVDYKRSQNAKGTLHQQAFALTMYDGYMDPSDEFIPLGHERPDLRAVLVPSNPNASASSGHALIEFATDTGLLCSQESDDKLRGNHRLKTNIQGHETVNYRMEKRRADGSERHILPGTSLQSPFANSPDAFRQVVPCDRTAMAPPSSNMYSSGAVLFPAFPVSWINGSGYSQFPLLSHTQPHGADLVRGVPQFVSPIMQSFESNSSRPILSARKERACAECNRTKCPGSWRRDRCERERPQRASGSS